MDALIKALIGLAILTFLLAIVGVTVVGGPVFGVLPEGLSRASSNMALIAIALALLKGGATAR